MINILHELISTVAPIDGISIGDENDKNTWHIDFKPEATPQQQAAAAQIIEAFDIQSAQDTIQRIHLRRQTAKATAKAIPNWATWTQVEWQNYFDAQLSDAQVSQVTSFAATREGMRRQNLVIQNLVKLVIALRDEIYPDLPE